ncbi:MerR family transcriptional regulator [Cohnella boryungensis]|uniref:Methyltransferase domain-containing protein n=1 Tax=Cohnella boryungensis TaxID=768479 RepID=A0ABV8S7V3_9BACL
MKIKEAADKLGISPRAIRLYEKRGLLSPAKQEGNRYRVFADNDIWRLQTIVSLREAGMSLNDIKHALAGWETNGMEELRYYLELQRSIIMSEWLQLKQVIETADRMIELVKTDQAVSLDHLYALASASRRLREQRSNWQDRWDFNRLAPTHDERVAESTGSYADYEQALDNAIRMVHPNAGERGLDIGTGTGNLAGRFRERGCVMSGVDQSREMLRLCQVKHPDMDTRVGNFLALPYLKEQFDFVVTSFAFHHLSREQQSLALEEMRRVLKPGGRICIADLMEASPLPQAAGQAGYPSVRQLAAWFAERGLATEYVQINEQLHVICAR